MSFGPRRRQVTALGMAAVMAITSLPVGVVHAGMVSTDQVLRTERVEQPSAEREDATRQRLKALLAQDEVRAQMVELGVDPDEAARRVDALTDTELAALAGRLDQLPAGEGVLTTALVVLFIVFGVTVILDAMGLVNVFPFVCGPGECTGAQRAAYPEPAAGPVDDYYYQDRRAPAYRDDRYGDQYSRRREPRARANEYYEPGPVPPARNYYEERFGTRRQIR